MQLRALLVINAVLATFHGLGFLILPVSLLGLYQITSGPGEQVMGQLFGTELLVVAGVTWWGRNLTDKGALRAIVLANLIANVVGTFVTTKAVMAGVMGTAGWLGVAIYGLLSLGYIYFVLAKAGATKLVDAT